MLCKSICLDAPPEIINTKFLDKEDVIYSINVFFHNSMAKNFYSVALLNKNPPRNNSGGLAVFQSLRIRLKDPWLCAPTSRWDYLFGKIIIVHLQEISNEL